MNFLTSLYQLNNTRSLEDLKSSTDTLSGADSQALRAFCTSESIDFTKDLNDDCYGRLFYKCHLDGVKVHFQSRVEALSNDPSAAAQELYTKKWGPTQIPVFNLLLMMIFLNPGSSSNYIRLVEYLIQTAKIPVDGTDLSGTTAMMHAISTKPYFEPSFAQLLFDAGGSINHRNRYGATAAHEIVSVRQYDAEGKRRSCEALSWFLSHGGDIDIKDGDGMSPRFVIGRLKSLVPEFGAVLDQNGPGGKPIPRATGDKKLGRNDPCSCGSRKKFKVCCGKV